jgi:hypothetical protein
MSLIPEWLSMTRLAWLRMAGRQFFLYLTNIIFLEKLAWEILEKIRKSIGLKLSCSPSFLALNFHVLDMKIQFVNQIQKERKSGTIKIVNEI